VLLSQAGSEVAQQYYQAVSSISISAMTSICIEPAFSQCANGCMFRCSYCTAWQHLLWKSGLMREATAAKACLQQEPSIRVISSSRSARW
jgi:pyruvate-formate lyase-activating enzyme